MTPRTRTRRCTTSPPPGRRALAVLEAAQEEDVQAAALKQALGGARPRSPGIVESSWLKEKDPATLPDLAAEFTVSAERIRQIEAKAMEKMKKIMLADAAPRRR